MVRQLTPAATTTSYVCTIKNIWTTCQQEYLCSLTASEIFCHMAVVQKGPSSLTPPLIQMASFHCYQPIPAKKNDNPKMPTMIFNYADPPEQREGFYIHLTQSSTIEEEGWTEGKVITTLRRKLLCMVRNLELFRAENKGITVWKNTLIELEAMETKLKTAAEASQLCRNGAPWEQAVIIILTNKFGNNDNRESVTIDDLEQELSDLLYRDHFGRIEKIEPILQRYLTFAEWNTEGILSARTRVKWLRTWQVDCLVDQKGNIF